jgi:catechol 2,3-dioxygenase-like lactoylglutathione lyase family enzyme
MIKGLRGATIWSEDVNNLLPFYRDLLGFKVGLQMEGFVVLGDLGTPTLALGTHSEVRGRNADPARHMVGLATDDVDADCKRLKAAGVEFVEDPTDYGTLRIATLRLAALFLFVGGTRSWPMAGGGWRHRRRADSW